MLYSFILSSKFGVKMLAARSSFQEEIFKLLNPKRLYDWTQRSVQAIHLIRSLNHDQKCEAHEQAARLFRRWHSGMLTEWGVYCAVTRIHPRTGKPVRRMVGVTDTESAAIKHSRRKFGPDCALFHTALFRHCFENHDSRFGCPSPDASDESIVLVADSNLKNKKPRIQTLLVLRQRSDRSQLKVKLLDVPVPELRLNFRNIRSEFRLAPQIKFTSGKRRLNLTLRPYNRWIGTIISYPDRGLYFQRLGWSFPIQTWRDLMAGVSGQQCSFRGRQPGLYCAYPWIPAHGR